MRYVVILIVVSVAAVLVAQERLTLTTPETTVTNTQYRIESVTLISDDPSTPAADGHITIRLKGIERPHAVDCQYGPATTPTGSALLNGLNKANLSTAYAGNATTGSLKQRIFHRLVVMNEAAVVCNRALAGTVTGSPE